MPAAHDFRRTSSSPAPPGKSGARPAGTDGGHPAALFDSPPRPGRPRPHRARVSARDGGRRHLRDLHAGNTEPSPWNWLRPDGIEGHGWDWKSWKDHRGRRGEFFSVPIRLERFPSDDSSDTPDVFTPLTMDIIFASRPSPATQEVDAAASGQQIACPACSKAITIPASPDEQHEGGHRGPPRPRPRRKSTSRSR